MFLSLLLWCFLIAFGLYAVASAPLLAFGIVLVLALLALAMVLDGVVVPFIKEFLAP